MADKGMGPRSSDRVVDRWDGSMHEAPRASQQEAAKLHPVPVQIPMKKKCVAVCTESFEGLPSLRYPIILRDDGKKSKFAVKCTACKRHHYYKEYFIHPLLHLPICASCHEKYLVAMSMTSRKGKHDAFCRWCGQNCHKLIPCSNCRASFCTRCLGQEEVTRILQEKKRHSNVATSVMDCFESYWDENESSNDHRKFLRSNKSSILIDPDSVTYDWSCLLCQPQYLLNLSRRNNWEAWRIQSLRILRKAKVLPPRSSKMRARIFFLETLSRPIIPADSHLPSAASKRNDYKKNQTNDDNNKQTNNINNRNTEVNNIHNNYKNKRRSNLKYKKKSSKLHAAKPIYDHNNTKDKIQSSYKFSYSQSIQFTHRLLDPPAETPFKINPINRLLPKYRCTSKGNSKLFVFPVPDATTATTQGIIASAEEWQESPTSNNIYHHDTNDRIENGIEITANDKLTVSFVFSSMESISLEDTHLYCTACKYSSKTRQSMNHDYHMNNNSRKNYRHARRPFYVHPLFHLPVCEKCHTQYLLGEFVEEDGNEWFCRWCGQGKGTLYLCDTCPKSFCSQCLGIKETTRIRMLQKPESVSKPVNYKKRIPDDVHYNSNDNITSSLTPGSRNCVDNRNTDVSIDDYVYNAFDNDNYKNNNNNVIGSEENEDNEDHRVDTLETIGYADQTGQPTTINHQDNYVVDGSDNNNSDDHHIVISESAGSNSKYSCYFCDPSSFNRLCEQTPHWRQWRKIGHRLWQQEASKRHEGLIDSNKQDHNISETNTVPMHSLLMHTSAIIPMTNSSHAYSDISNNHISNDNFHSYLNTDIEDDLLKPFHLLYEAVKLSSFSDFSVGNLVDNDGYHKDFVFEEVIFQPSEESLQQNNHMDVCDDSQSNDQDNDGDERDGAFSDNSSVSSSDIQSISTFS